MLWPAEAMSFPFNHVAESRYLSARTTCTVHTMSSNTNTHKTNSSYPFVLYGDVE